MSDAVEILDDAIERQKTYVDQWRQPVEPLLFETLRAIDTLFCQGLFEGQTSEGTTARLYQAHSTWGVNHALSRMIPDALPTGPFRLFPSSKQAQAQVDEFLFQCGVLQQAQTVQGWLHDGLVSARVDKPTGPMASGIETIIVLKSDHPSMFSEQISREHRRWVSDLTMAHDEPWEHELSGQHARLMEALERSVTDFNGWGIAYTTNKEIDEHFLQCGTVYLRRMWGQDLIGTDDMIGGEPFGHYMGVLAAIAGRAEKHLCYVSILKRRNPALDLRNLLTTYAPCKEFVRGLASHLDATTDQVQKLLSPLTLGPENLRHHTSSAETAWAPIVRSSRDHYILPLFGLDTNPFLFLLTDLRARNRADWDRVANDRERRWIQDLKHIFGGERWHVHDRNLKLRDGDRTITDLDFIAFDTTTNQLALFQLKWQHPVGMDNRSRRSAGANLLAQGNDWIERVTSWLDKHGVQELAKRANLAVSSDVKAELFVVGRYNAHFSGFSGHDTRATWVDWNHFMKARVENPRASVCDLAAILRAEAARLVTDSHHESYALPLGNLAILLNPATEPAP